MTNATMYAITEMPAVNVTSIPFSEENSTWSHSSNNVSLIGDHDNATGVMNTFTTNQSGILAHNPALSVTPRWYLGYDIPLMVLFVSVTCCGTLNWMLVLALCLEKKLRRSFSILLGALAVVYGVLSTVIAPMEIWDVSQKLAGNTYTWCRFKVILRTWGYYISLFLIFIIGVVRLVHGMRTRKLRVHPVCYVALCLTALAATIPCILDQAGERSIGVFACQGDLMHLLWLLRETSTWAGAFIPTALIFIATVISYVALIVILQIREQAVKKSINSSQNPRPHVVTSKVALWVLIGLLISYLSPFISVLVGELGYLVTLGEVVHNISLYNSAMFIQSIIFPFAYLVQNSLFRCFVKKICCMKFRSSVTPTGGTEYPLGPSS